MHTKYLVIFKPTGPYNAFTPAAATVISDKSMSESQSHCCVRNIETTLFLCQAGNTHVLGVKQF